jgi:hypothetical protein
MSEFYLAVENRVTNRTALRSALSECSMDVTSSKQYIENPY